LKHGTTTGVKRCPWVSDDPIYIAYHDEEWGVVEKDDRALFEKLILDGFQAGLSWITILRKRENFRAAFDGFEPRIIERYDKAKLKRLMNDSGIIRNRAKIESTVKSARAYLEIVEEPGGFSDFIWEVTGGRTIQNRWKTLREIPTESEESRRLSKKLKARGFNFVGPTIVYAFMQAVGMVNDHIVECFRHRAVVGPTTHRVVPRRRSRARR
jgi:DNA-3-methyladenine glycosylase I